MVELPVALTWNPVEHLPGALAWAHRVLPLRAVGDSLEILTSEPENTQLAENLAFALNREVRLLACEPHELERLLQLHYGDDPNRPEVAPGQPGSPKVAALAAEPSATDLTAMSGQPPVIQLVNQVLTRAISDQASDIHFEPFEHEFKIRCRVDGVLYTLTSPVRELALPVTSRLKVLANLDIAERRTPQDGRIRVTLNGRTVDLRVSTLPTQCGESVVLRVLDQAAVELELTALGLPGDVLAGMQEVIHRPNGIVLVTGPTGSGKTTTLYSGLRAISTPEVKLLTIEDPVEYEIEGIMQVPVNPGAGLTFDTALRAFLRQDPDVIMVGEIRDLETASIAVQASLTGHLVLSTLHTNDAPASVTRLIDMGVEPYLLASTVEAVLAQRLVRRICPDCRITCQPRADLMRQLELKPAEWHERPCFRGRGCKRCGQTGYRGRLGIFEWLIMTEPLRELVSQKAPAQLLSDQARQLGLRTLREEGLRAVMSGVTTLEEIAKHT
jgi:type IV pilus assembly protein PilB